MPEISRFFGTIIAMYYNDHPPPHFHVRHGAQKASIEIDSLSVLDGRLSPRVLSLVTEWAACTSPSFATIGTWPASNCR